MPDLATITEQTTVALTDSIPPVLVARPVEPVLVDAKVAAAMLSISVRTLLDLNRKGLCPRPVLSLRTLRWSRQELEYWAKSGCLPRSRWEPLWAASLRAIR